MASPSRQGWVSSAELAGPGARAHVQQARENPGTAASARIVLHDPEPAARWARAAAVAAC